MARSFGEFWLAHIRNNPAFARPEALIRIRNLEVLMREAYKEGQVAGRAERPAPAPPSLTERLFGRT